MSTYTCPHCGASGRDEVFHRPECPDNPHDLGARLSALEGSVDALEEDNLDNRLADLEEDVAKLLARVTAIEGDT